MSSSNPPDRAAPTTPPRAAAGSWRVAAETPDPPPAAATVFGDNLAAATRYAELLCGPGVVRGLIGPRESGRIWERHLLNCAVLGELVPAGAHVVDLGSGAGLPGIPLALARPDLQVDLVEPMARRATFLQEVVAELGLTERVRVIRARADDHGRTAGRQYDVVTARAVAALDRLVTMAAPLLRPAGVLLAIKGESVEDEIATMPHAATVHLVGQGVVDPLTTVVRVARPRRRHPAGDSGRRKEVL